MTDPTQEQIDTTKHQQEYQLQKEDALDIALLANVVGRELTQVDKFAVSGLQKATRIDQQKIFNKQANNTTSQTQSAPPPLAKPPPQLAQPVNPPVKTPAVVQTDDRLIEYLKSIDSRLQHVESLYEDILKTLHNKTDEITITLNKNDKD